MRISRVYEFAFLRFQSMPAGGYRGAKTIPFLPLLVCEALEGFLSVSVPDVVDSVYEAFTDYFFEGVEPEFDAEGAYDKFVKIVSPASYVREDGKAKYLG